MNKYIANEKMPLLIPAAGFDAKLSMTEKNIEHTEAFMASGVKRILFAWICNSSRVSSTCFCKRGALPPCYRRSYTGNSICGETGFP